MKGAQAMKRLIELGKSILIVLLICSLLLLFMAAIPMDTIRDVPWLSQLMQPIAPLLGLTQAELTYVEAAPTILDAAQPVSISVRNSAGRSSAIWDFAALDAAYESLGSYLGQALDTAEIFTKVSQYQLQTVLSGTSVYFQYGCPLPASLLASWLGATLEAAVPEVSGCILSVSGSAVRLYLVGETSYVADTPLDAGELDALLEAYRPDGSQLAFEAGASLSSLSLIPGNTCAVPAASVSDPITSRFVEQLATDLGFNPYGETRYTDTGGSIHFSEANCALEITADGRILLTSAAEDRFAAAGPDIAALVETARQLVSLATGDNLGAGRLYLSGLAQTEAETVCTFDYLVSGIPVVLDGGSAATVTFTGQAVTEMTVRPCTFTASGELLYPLPVAQAAVLLPTGSELNLQYRITAENTLEAGWKK